MQPGKETNYPDQTTGSSQEKIQQINSKVLNISKEFLNLYSLIQELNFSDKDGQLVPEYSQLVDGQIKNFQRVNEQIQTVDIHSAVTEPQDHTYGCNKGKQPQIYKNVQRARVPCIVNNNQGSSSQGNSTSSTPNHNNILIKRNYGLFTNPNDLPGSRTVSPAAKAVCEGADVASSLSPDGRTLLIDIQDNKQNHPPTSPLIQHSSSPTYTNDPNAHPSELVARPSRAKQASGHGDSLSSDSLKNQLVTSTRSDQTGHKSRARPDFLPSKKVKTLSSNLEYQAPVVSYTKKQRVQRRLNEGEGRGPGNPKYPPLLGGGLPVRYPPTYSQLNAWSQGQEPKQGSILHAAQGTAMQLRIACLTAVQAHKWKQRSRPGGTPQGPPSKCEGKRDGGGDRGTVGAKEGGRGGQLQGTSKQQPPAWLGPLQQSLPRHRSEPLDFLGLQGPGGSSRREPRRKLRSNLSTRVSSQGQFRVQAGKKSESIVEGPEIFCSEMVSPYEGVAKQSNFGSGGRTDGSEGQMGEREEGLLLSEKDDGSQGFSRQRQMSSIPEENAIESVVCEQDVDVESQLLDSSVQQEREHQDSDKKIQNSRLNQIKWAQSQSRLSQQQCISNKKSEGVIKQDFSQGTRGAPGKADLFQKFHSQWSGGEGTSPSSNQWSKLNVLQSFKAANNYFKSMKGFSFSQNASPQPEQLSQQTVQKKTKQARWNTENEYIDTNYYDSNVNYAVQQSGSEFVAQMPAHAVGKGEQNYEEEIAQAIFGLYSQQMSTQKINNKLFGLFEVQSPQAMLWWDLVASLLTCVLFLVTPFEFSFRIYPNLPWSFFIYIDQLIFLFCVVDIFQRLRTAVESDEGRNQSTGSGLIWEPWSIIHNHLWTLLLIDLPSLLNIDLIFLIPSVRSTVALHASQGTKYPLLVSSLYLKSIRILKILQLPARLSRLKFVWMIETRIGAALTRALEMTIGVFLCIHLTACVLYFTSNHEQQLSGTWLHKYYLAQASDLGPGWQYGLPVSVSSVPMARRYFDSLYWVIVTITSVGYGEVYPLTVIEKVAIMVTTLVGVSMFAYLGGVITSLLTAQNSSKAKLLARQQEVVDFLFYHNVPSWLGGRIRNYLAYVARKQVYNDDTDFVHKLPISLRVELIEHLFRGLIDRVPIFKTQNKLFRTQLVSYLKPMYYAPNDVVLLQGQPCLHMYFISDGRVHVKYYDQTPDMEHLGLSDVTGTARLIQELEEARQTTKMTSNDINDRLIGHVDTGSYMCGYSCLMGLDLRVTVIAGTFTELYSVSREDLDELFADFPQEVHAFSPMQQDTSDSSLDGSSSDQMYKGSQIFSEGSGIFKPHQASQQTSVQLQTEADIANVPLLKSIGNRQKSRRSTGIGQIDGCAGAASRPLIEKAGNLPQLPGAWAGINQQRRFNKTESDLSAEQCITQIFGDHQRNIPKKPEPIVVEQSSEKPVDSSEVKTAVRFADEKTSMLRVVVPEGSDTETTDTSRESSTTASGSTTLDTDTYSEDSSEETEEDEQISEVRSTKDLTGVLPKTIFSDLSSATTSNPLFDDPNSTFKSCQRLDQSATSELSARHQQPESYQPTSSNSQQICQTDNKETLNNQTKQPILQSVINDSNVERDNVGSTASQTNLDPQPQILSDTVSQNQTKESKEDIKKELSAKKGTGKNNKLEKVESTNWASKKLASDVVKRLSTSETASSKAKQRVKLNQQSPIAEGKEQFEQFQTQSPGKTTGQHNPYTVGYSGPSVSKVWQLGKQTDDMQNFKRKKNGMETIGSPKQGRGSDMNSASTVPSQALYRQYSLQSFSDSGHSANSSQFSVTNANLNRQIMMQRLVQGQEKMAGAKASTMRGQQTVHQGTFQRTSGSFRNSGDDIKKSNIQKNNSEEQDSLWVELMNHLVMDFPTIVFAQNQRTLEERFAQFINRRRA